MAERPRELLSELPEVLTEPLIYLSASQALECKKRERLSYFAGHLPGWLPHKIIAKALGFGEEGIARATEHAGGAYVWATEFENVHTLWDFTEPSLVIGGKRYSDSEAYYHAQKPVPFDDAKWQSMRVDVMRTAVRAKFAASAEACSLLMLTHPHPLLSIKGDRFWGFDATRGGENKLAELLMELRAELVADRSSSLLAETPAPIFVISGPAAQASDAMSRVWSAILPHLPPLVQQQLAAGSEAEQLEIRARVLKRAADDGSGEGVLRVRDSRHALKELECMRQRGELDGLIVSAKPLLRAAYSDGGAAADGAAGVEEDEDASAAHSVLQRGIGAVATSLSSKAAPVGVRVEYKGQEHTVYALPSLTGLMLKSKVIAELGLDGGFQDYYLRLEGTAFGSRTPVSAHAGFGEGCRCLLEDVGDRPKAVGMT